MVPAFLSGILSLQLTSVRGNGGLLRPLGVTALPPFYRENAAWCLTRVITSLQNPLMFLLLLLFLFRKSHSLEPNKCRWGIGYPSAVSLICLCVQENQAPPWLRERS